jgi:polysaccharide biosynthesis protein PslH
VRIAFVTGDAPWPSTAGGRLRDAATFEAASAVGEVRLVSFPFGHAPDMARMPPDARIYPMPWPTSAVRRMAQRAIATARRRHVFQEHLLRHGALPLLRQALAEIRPDATILGYPLFGPFVEAARASSPYVIVDLLELRGGDIEARIRTQPRWTERARARLDGLVLGHVERGVAHHADEVWFVTEADATRYRTWTGRATRVVPNTVDVDRYAPYRETQSEPGSMSYVGAFDNAANVHAATRLATRILPGLRARRPDARLTVVGRRPSPELARTIAASPGASLIADAPDALDAVARNGPLVAPLESGTGSKLKVIEAAASGIPIVTTAYGVTGLAFNHEREVLLASSDEEFVAAIERIWNDPALGLRLREAALATVMARYDRHVANAAIAAALDPAASASRPAESDAPGPAAPEPGGRSA